VRRLRMGDAPACDLGYCFRDPGSEEVIDPSCTITEASDLAYPVPSTLTVSSLCRGMVDIESEEVEHPFFTLIQAPKIRVGLIPTTYNAATKKATWYWFMAIAVNDKVCTSWSHAHLAWACLQPGL
jgi:hypothetical protein